MPTAADTRTPYIALDPEAFRWLVDEFGERIGWYRSRPCSCYNPANNSYQSDGSRDCPFGCEHGFLYTLVPFYEMPEAPDGDVSDDYPLLPDGTYSYRMAWVLDMPGGTTTNEGRWGAPAEFAVVGQGVRLGPLPVAPEGVTALKIYRKAAGAKYYRLAATIAAADLAEGDATWEDPDDAPGAKPPVTTTADIMAYIYNVKREFVDPNLGLIQIGDSLITVMFDEVPLNVPDKLVLLDSEFLASEVVAKGTDRVSSRPVKDLVKITMDGRDTPYIEGTDYSWDRNGTIEWLSGGEEPDPNSNYTVELYYHPTWWFLGSGNRRARPVPGTETRLPMRGILTLRHPMLGDANAPGTP